MPRALPRRVRPANPALLARPGAFLSPTQAGPAPSRSRHSAAAELTLLPSLSTSCTPRGVAPPLSPSPPPQPPERVLPFLPSVSCHPGVSGLTPRSRWVSPALPRRLRARSARSLARCRPGRRFSHPRLAASRPDSGSRGPTPPPPRTRALLARPLLPTQATGRSAPSFPLASRSPGALALALSQASALPAGALRAPASPGSCQCGDCAGKHGDRGNDPHKPRPSNPCWSPHR